MTAEEWAAMRLGRYQGRRIRVTIYYDDLSFPVVATCRDAEEAEHAEAHAFKWADRINGIVRDYVIVGNSGR